MRFPSKILTSDKEWLYNGFYISECIFHISSGGRLTEIINITEKVMDTKGCGRKDAGSKMCPTKQK